MKAESQVREWGRSLGVVIPKDVVSQEHIKAGDKITLLILKKPNPIKEIFGTFKFKKSTQKILDEADRESWDE